MRRRGRLGDARGRPRHLRAAIDLAEPDELPELYETLGTYMLAGPGAFDALLKGLRSPGSRAEGPMSSFG